MASRKDRPIKDKEQTKRRLINAVAEIFKSEGYTGLGVNKVARIAGVNKKLIYRYFGSFDGLKEAYVVETDYWLLFSQKMREAEVPEDKDSTRRLISELLQNQFTYVHGDQGMQELILWELSSNSDLMRSIHRIRESMGSELLQMTDTYLTNEKVNFRAIAALLVGGIYYMILHSRHSGGMFSGIDLRSVAGRQEIRKAIDLVIEMAFDKGK